LASVYKRLRFYLVRLRSIMACPGAINRPEHGRQRVVAQGFEFLCYKIERGEGRLRYREGGLDLYAYPRDRTIERFKNRVRHITTRRNPKTL
jgi:hypothetical protein